MNENNNTVGKKVRVKKAPLLVCKITGKSRYTSHPYLEEKAARLGVSKDFLINNYIAKTTVNSLRKGKNVKDINPNINISDAELAMLVKCNSKSKVDFRFIDGQYIVLNKTKVEEVKDNNIEEVIEEEVIEEDNFTDYTDQDINIVNSEELFSELDKVLG